MLAAGSLSAEKGFIVNDVPQWKLTYMEDFSLSIGDFVSDTPEDGAVVTTKCNEVGRYSPQTHSTGRG